MAIRKKKKGNFLATEDISEDDIKILMASGVFSLVFSILATLGLGLLVGFKK